MMKRRNRLISILLAAVMVLSIIPFSALTAFADGGYTVTLYANDGLGTQEQIENVSGLYVLPECTFAPPPEMTFLAWAIGSQSGEQKQPGAAINITGDTLIVAIWTESAAIYETRPNGGTTAVNGSFDIRYRLTIQPEMMYLEFYNDYQGKWAEKYMLATMPEYEGALTHFSVPTIHKDTAETVRFRLCACKDGINYYGNEFVVKYTDCRFVVQPSDALLTPGTEYEVTYAMSFVPSAVTVEYKQSDQWKHYSNADAAGASISGGDGEKVLNLRIKAVGDGEVYYSRVFTVRWADVTEVGTFAELLNAVNEDKIYIRLTNSIKDVVPDDELPTKHRLIFDGGVDYLLDLNGHTLEVLNHINEYYTANFSMIEVSNGSALEIQNGSLAFDNFYAGSNRKARGVVHVEDTSEFAATDVDMNNRYTGTVVSATADAKVTLLGGEYIVQNGFALYLDRQASLTLDNDIYIHTVMGDCANTQYVDGYGALYSESTGELVVNCAFFKSGIQVSNAQIGAFSTATHEVTINGKVLSEDIFIGNLTEARAQNKEYYWYSYNQNALESVENNSFVNTVRVISYEKKYPLEVKNGTAMVNGTPVTEACYGQSVTIVADTPEEGMEFAVWSTNGVVLEDYHSASTNFTMPAAPVYLAASYDKVKVKSIALTATVPVAGQSIADVAVNAEGGVTVEIVEWYENKILMDEEDVFIPGKTYEIKVLVYPPEGNRFDDVLTATVNGQSATVSANEQYAYVYYEVVTLPDNPFPVIYNAATAQLGVGGRLELDTTLMAEQSAFFREAYEAGTVEYHWYKDGELVEWAETSAYYFELEDVGCVFFVTVTVGDQTAWGYGCTVTNHLYQIFLNADEIIPGGKAPQISSATSGVEIVPDSLYIMEGYGLPAMDVQKMILIPGKSYILVGELMATGAANLPHGAYVHVNGEMLREGIDGTFRFFYEFTVPEADYPVYYQANGEIGIGVTLTVDIEKMCNESGTFQHACEAANPTYQTVFYQWYRNGERINGATKLSYTVTTADKNSYIHCKVTLVDGKYGIGEQFVISNVITVINLNMPLPVNGQNRIDKSEMSADGVTVTGIMWWPTETGATMQANDTYVEGTAYEFYIEVQANDTFLLDFTGEMTKLYVNGTEAIAGGSVPNQGKASYIGEMVATHAHQYSDEVWGYDEDGHWQVCVIPGCPDPNGEYGGYVYHYGGNATCRTAGSCKVCGAEYYGEHDVAVTNYVYIDDMKCGSYCATDGCDYLSEWSYHTGGTSDCQHKAVCDICHHEYGDVANHAFASGYEFSSADGHAHKCTTQGCAEHDALVPHGDANGDGKCDDCGYSMSTNTPGNDSEPGEDSKPPVDNPPAKDPGDAPGGLGAGAVAAIVIGAVVVVGFGGFALTWFVIKKKTFADLVATFRK